MTIEAQAGDVILVVQEGGLEDPISELIQRVTRSPYSHTILALGDGKYTDANPDLHGDITIWDETFMKEHVLPKVERVDLFSPRGTRADAALLHEKALEFQERALPATQSKVKFSDGALAGLALLRLLNDVPASLYVSGTIERLRDAIFVALEDGDTRLFCSEYVFRVLDAAGQRPRLPNEPIISLDGFPTDEPQMHGEDLAFLKSALDRIKDWLEAKWQKLLNAVGFTPDTIPSFTEKWELIRAAYDAKAAPDLLHVANFFTPVDFEHSDFDKVGTRSKGTGWVTPS